MFDVTEAVEAALEGCVSDQTLPHGAPTMHRRLLRALAAENTAGILSGADFAALLRAVVREASTLWRRDGVWVPERRILDLSDRTLTNHGLQASHHNGGRVRIRALPWSPEWLRDPGACDIETALYSEQVVSPEVPVPPDPVLLRIGYSCYASDAQREAVRAILGAAPGSTFIVVLPTGAGKTVCGLLPAVQALDIAGCVEADRYGVTPFVVPTTSLALDLERRVAESGLLTHPTAWRPGTESADAIRSRIRAGTQGPVFASPEAIGGGLRESLLAAAESGCLRFFVVDEAHMVATWGDEFRPAFQQLATLCRELREVTTSPFSLVLMSATLTGHALTTLVELFTGGSGFHVMHACRLRPEPRYYWQHASNPADRRVWMLDALAHLPRPAILYTTRREDAANWHRDLCSLGYRRVGLIHGASTDTERDKALSAWRSDSLDLMVATSAFGLGVDKRDVRAVLHAAFPESLDRYYQEVGRGGRDGRASLALMLWTDVDENIARGLARPTFIGAERGSERWTAMFTSHERVVCEDGSYLVPTDVSPSTRREDIDMQGEENERWNQRTLLLMQRAGALSVLGTEQRSQSALRRRQFARVRLAVDGHLEDAFWTNQILPRRSELLAACARDWDLIRGAVRADRCLAFALQEQYVVSVPSVDVVRACGSCPCCRRRGGAPTAGQLRMRHSLSPGAAVYVPKREDLLRGVLADHECGTIFVDSADTEPDRLLPLAEWLVRHGIRDLVLDSRFGEAWLKHFAHPAFPAVFFHEDRLCGIRRKWPAAAFFPRGEPSELGPGSMVILRADTRDPARPDRRLADVLTGANWSLGQFMDRYVE